ncbi:MAG TPA: ParB N-terminal domain-containing protein [Candidatus Binatia bacterium]|nr:ParB N-terminal domain-containing protein [Candidatus Binatia bacterium]
MRAAGGAVVGAYRDPLAAGPLVVAVLPLESVQPTPFQRELSPTHAKRLAERIEQSGAFLDPIIVVPVVPLVPAVADSARFWTPNGRHRLAAAGALGLRTITALVSADADLAFKILALNTEKAHNLRDRSLEVIRMARARAKAKSAGKEADFAVEFESAALLTLGILYEDDRRFSGGAYLPMLRKVDRFSSASLAASLRSREGFAARIAEIDRRVAAIVARLQERGFRSPYLRTFVVARVNPVRWLRPKKGAGDTPSMPLGEALTRMSRGIQKFDVDSVKSSELAMIAAVAPAESE